jgi:hypothetical protein
MKDNLVIFFLCFVIILLFTIYSHSDIMENLEFSTRVDNDRYHKTEGEIEATSQIGSYLIGQDGKLQYQLFPKLSPQITYYEPGTYTYGSTTWVPDYTESILLASDRMK